VARENREHFMLKLMAIMMVQTNERTFLLTQQQVRESNFASPSCQAQERPADPRPRGGLPDPEQAGAKRPALP
jgi:hypothetical protein